MDVDKAERRMSIAVVCPRFPLPMTRADQMTVAHLLAFLSARGHTVDLYSLYDDAPPAATHCGWVKRRCRNVTVFTQPRWRNMAGMVKALLRGQPLQVGWFDNARLKRSLRRLPRERLPDVVYAYTLRSAEPVRRLGRSACGEENANGGRRPVTYLAMQVSQSLNTRRIAVHASRLWEKLTYRLEHRLTAAYEARIWRNFTRTVLIGRSDVQEIRRACADRNLPGIDNYLLSPHGVDVDRFRPCGDESVDACSLIFCGVMATNTNASAVLWFTNNVWPRVQAEFPHARFLIVGRRPRREILALAGQPGIAVTGEVPDTADYIGRATLCVNPMQAGAGMQNKLLEYMAMAKAVIATSVANEGIGARPGKEIIIADDASEFAAATISLLRDAARRDALGRSARAFVKRGWSWEAHFLKLEADMLEKLFGGSASGCVAAPISIAQPRS